MESEKPIDFFSNEDNKALIKQVYSSLKVVESSDQDSKGNNFITDSLKQLLFSIHSNSEKYDELCQTNINWIGSAFISSLRDYADGRSVGNDSIAKMFTMAYRFLCELEFSMPEKLNMELSSLKIGIDDNLSFFSTDEKRQIIFANYIMPSQIAKILIHHENIQNIKEINSIFARAKKEKDDWDIEFTKRTNEITEISNTLKKYKNAFNFVGLYDGFKELSDIKNKEKFWIFLSLIAIGLALVFPLVYEINFIINNQEYVVLHKDIMLFVVLPLITLELVLLYFFRIVLFNYKSVKALLVQIELRKTLCQFIQNYSDYSKDIKTKDSNSLEKFENLIFSGLITNEENLPSTFDGIEHITKVIKSIKES